MKKLLQVTLVLFLFTGNVFAESITNPVIKLLPETKEGYNYLGGDHVTGFFINDEGYILTTADNVLYKNDQYQYAKIAICLKEISLGEDCPLEAEIISISPGFNLALLKVTETTDLEFDFEEPIFMDYSPKNNEEVTFKGYGYERYEFTNTMHQLGDESLTPTYKSAFKESTGKVVMSEFIDENINGYFLTDAPMNLGNSGSPVYNKDGDLIGLASAYGNGTDNNYYLIPPSTGNSVSYVISSDSILIFFLSMQNNGFIDMELIETLFSDEEIEKVGNTIGKIDPAIFNDVDITSSYHQAISYLKKNNIVGGYADQTFKPNNELNRAELLKILVEAADNNPEAGQYKNCFPDVKEDWYARYVCFAKEKGWIEGYPDGSFKPDSFVNRAEAIKMLMGVFDLYKRRDENSGGFDGHPYLDVSVGTWYMQYVGQAQELGILEETNGYFYPSNNITRGQISEVIYRVLILLISTEN